MSHDAAYRKFIAELKRLATEDKTNVAARFLLTLDEKQGQTAVCAFLKDAQGGLFALDTAQTEILRESMRPIRLDRRDFLAIGAAITGGALLLGGLGHGIAHVNDKEDPPKKPSTFLGLELTDMRVSQIMATSGALLAALGISGINMEKLGRLEEARPEQSIAGLTCNLCARINGVLQTPQAMRLTGNTSPSEGGRST